MVDVEVDGCFGMLNKALAEVAGCIRLLGSAVVGAGGARGRRTFFIIVKTFQKIKVLRDR
jgi:hypothetical protein